MNDVAEFWSFINVFGLLVGLLNIACAVAIYTTVKHMGDDDRDVDTTDPDIDFVGDGIFEDEIEMASPEFQDNFPWHPPDRHNATFDDLFPWHPPD